MEIIWTDYLRYRAVLRGFDLARIEEVVRYSGERYFDNTTGRLVVIGPHSEGLMLIPYELEEGAMRPVTVHAVTRSQIVARIKAGRFTHE